MNSSHTPGPWTVDDYHSRAGHPDAGFYIHMTTENGHFAIAKAYSGNVGEDVALPNAALIAAAPDLLAAAIKTLEGMTGEYGEAAADVRAPGLRAAISKATGTP